VERGTLLVCSQDRRDSERVFIFLSPETGARIKDRDSQLDKLWRRNRCSCQAPSCTCHTQPEVRRYSDVNQFSTVAGNVCWEADADGLTIRVRNRSRKLRWREVTAAGLVQLPGAAVPADMPTSILPGLGKLVDLDRRLAREQRQLVLARGGSTFRAVRIPIPLDEPEAKALVEMVRGHVGDRWIGELPMAEHQRALGLSIPWWFYPLFAVGFVAFGLTILLAIGAFQALSTGDVAGVPPLAWLALVFWGVLAGGILFVYRNRG
jgi:hypothetical protein